MNLKHILAAGALFFTCTIFAQTSAGIRAYNSSPSIIRGDMEYQNIVMPYTEELNLILRAAEQGDASAQFNMALRYESGHGVPQDHAESLKWLRKAAEQGFVEAQYNLGCMYNTGEGVSQDHAEAVDWLRKAAEQGYASAQKNLGVNYGVGQGVPQSDAEAYVWSSIAAISGDDGAINNRNFAASRLSPENLSVAQKRAKELHREIQQRMADK